LSMKIKYTINGTLDVDEDGYSESCLEETGRLWSSLSTEEKIDYIKSVEEDAGYEGIFEDANQPCNKVTIEVVL